LSSIINSEQNTKIITYFPEDKRKLRVLNIYKGSKDGWSKEEFGKKVFDQGPNIVLIKTKLGAICGGFTSKSKDDSGVWVKDTEAFIFNLENKFTPNDYSLAMHQNKNGIYFGSFALKLTGDYLNADNMGYSSIGKGTYYNIEGDS
jgi:hypothetical protein